MAKAAGRNTAKSSSKASVDNKAVSRQTRATARAEQNKQSQETTTSGDGSDVETLPSIRDIKPTRTVPQVDPEPEPEPEPEPDGVNNDNALQDEDSHDEDFHGSDSSSVSDAIDYAAMHKDIIKNLGVLDDRAGNIIELLTTTSIKECMALLMADSSELRTDLEDFLETFRPAYRKFTDAQLIGLEAFKDIVTKQNRPHLEATMICIKANLAVFTLGLSGYDKDLERVEVAEVLEHLLMGAYPANFIAYGNGTPPMAIYKDQKFARLTEDLGVALVTQFFMLEFRENEGDPDFDGKACLDQAFLIPEQDENEVKDLSLKTLIPITARFFRNKMKQRYNTIRQTLARSPESLSEQYPVDDLWETATSWVALYTKALDTRVLACGGVKAIVKLLKDHVVEQGSQHDFHGVPATPPQPMRQRTSASHEDRDRLHSSQDDSVRTPFRALTEESRERSNLVVYPPASHKASMPNTIPETPRSGALGSPELSDSEEIGYLQPLEEAGNDDQEEQAINETQPEAADVYVDPSIMSDIVPTQETADVLQIAGKTNKENEPPRPRRGLLDSQPGARRVTFDDEDDEEVAPPQQPTSSHTTRDGRSNDEGPTSSDSVGMQKPPPSGQRPNPALARRNRTPTVPPEDEALNEPNKRRRDRDSDDEDDNNNFTQDKRGTKIPRPDYAQSNIHASSSREDNAMFFGDDETPEPGPVQRPAPAPSRTRTTAPPSTAPAAREPSREPTVAPSSSAPGTQSVADRHAEARAAAPAHLAAAKAYTQVTQGRQIKKPQQRRQWTEGETRRLVELMDQHGTSWSYLKQMDGLMEQPLLHGRSQVQLKDKARNMKADFLKSGMPLPECFMPVTLSKKILDDLRARGVIVPDQNEEEE